MSAYRTKPVAMSGMPGGIPFIIGNEAAERFSFYGMRTVLVVFMTRHLLNADGEAFITETQAKEYYHQFNAAVYFFPLLGALLADAFLGKYRTILLLSTVYCVGHAVLAFNLTASGLFWGLGLIAVGSGIKSCVSAHVGDQFGKQNERLIDQAFQWFYLSINVGAAASSALTPVLLDRYGPHVAFGLPGVMMVLATFVFWLGRHRFVHVPAGGMQSWRDLTSREGMTTVARLAGIFAFAGIFWALYDQQGSSWVLQARKLDRHIFGVEFGEAQFQWINPVFILLLLPTITYGVNPYLERWFKITALGKVCLGLFLMVGSFALLTLLQAGIDAGQTPSIFWQVLACFIITAAEVWVSVTLLDFSYTQAPNRLKSAVMAVNMLSVWLGNTIDQLLARAIQDESGNARLSDFQQFAFFTGLGLIAAVAFVFVAWTYKERTFVQGEDESITTEA